jgi:hypothetical protein
LDSGARIRKEKPSILYAKKVTNAASAGRLVFQDDMGERLLGSVGDRERDVFRPKLGGDGGRLTM